MLFYHLSCEKVSRKYTIMTVLGITVLVFLMLVSSSGCVSFLGISNSGSNNGPILNKSDEALKAHDKAIEINPHDWSAWYGKGNSLKELGNYDEALKAYDKAIEINPQNTDTWNNKGDVLTKLNKSDEALKAFDKAIEINPQNADAWNNKGVALDNLDKYEDAMMAFDKAIEISPRIQIPGTIKEMLYLNKINMMKH